MKILHILLFIIFATQLDANIKWIPIESIESKNKSNNSKNISDKEIRELQPVKKMAENLRVIQYLLDNKHNKKKENNDSKKNWYIIKNMENKEK